MSTSYHVYANSGTGTPVDYSTVVATVSALTWTSAVLARPSDTLFAVRAFDTVSGLEESNVDAVARVTLDGSGVDISTRPAPPSGLTVRPGPAGSLVVRWHYSPLANRPTGFKVWATAGGTVNFAASPAATVPFDAGALDYSTTLAGLTGGTSYGVGVRAYLTSPATDDGNTGQAVATADSAGPGAVDGLGGAAV